MVGQSLNQKSDAKKKIWECPRSVITSSLTAKSRVTVLLPNILNRVTLDLEATTRAETMPSILIPSRAPMVITNNIEGEVERANIRIQALLPAPRVRHPVARVPTVVPTRRRLLLLHPPRLPTVATTAPRRVVLAAQTLLPVAVNPSTPVVT